MARTTIAVTGTGNSGKTMFLTSLLWQLREWDNADFSIGSNARISAFAPCNGKPAPDDTFPFDKFQDALVERGEWPTKTRDVQRYSCEYRRDDRHKLRRRQRLDLIDLPGERVADAGIAAYADFGDWSDHMFEYFESHSGYEAGHRYRSAVETGDAEPKAVIGAYRQVLAEFVRDKRPLVTPSTFLLDANGVLARQIGLGEECGLAEERLAGLEAEAQFAPLPPVVREEHPELTREIRDHFERYRKEIAKPYFDHLASSKSLVVLVDIPLLLRGDVGRFNDTRQTIEDLFTTLSQESTLGKRLARTVKRLSLGSSLKRVAFVANKADLVSREDWKSDGLRSLLRQMSGRARELLPNVETEWFVCSACVSTERGSEEHSLVGTPLHGNVSKELYEFPVSPLPETWPREWQPGDFSYRDVYPKVDANVLYPPRHHQLDAVFDFVAMR